MGLAYYIKLKFFKGYTPPPETKSVEMTTGTHV